MCAKNLGHSVGRAGTQFVPIWFVPIPLVSILIRPHASTERQPRHRSRNSRGLGRSRRGLITQSVEGDQRPPLGRCGASCERSGCPPRRRGLLSGAVAFTRRLDHLVGFEEHRQGARRQTRSPQSCAHAARGVLRAAVLSPQQLPAAWRQLAAMRHASSGASSLTAVLCCRLNAKVLSPHR